MKLLALTIGGNVNNDPGFTLNNFPKEITQLNNTVTLQKLLSFATSFLLTIAVLLAFIFLLIGGLRWITSGGDKKQLETAQKTIMYALIGLVVVFLSFFLINLIGYVFGVGNHLLIN